jgi:hypothetical protein
VIASTLAAIAALISGDSPTITRKGAPTMDITRKADLATIQGQPNGSPAA